MAQSLAMPVAPALSVLYKGGNPSNSISNTLCLATSTPPKYIHGIGRTRARQILCDLNLENKITKDLSEEELISVRDEVSKFMIEGDLRRFNALAIRRLIEIQCYRGVRHQKGLPCRGQRTKNNCRTLKGKKVAIAGKKKAPR
ncbi:30S ribosomal protein S13, chloroplastic isoform X2 [Macadamia integrifolia]|uniref:30S ribosomal protein S13, chloroplastic isoform X2 n=1 Tax=Macadamia integrifolia TaxID=60698 RepID=UPI001C4E6965|nr:30S ribosomal protein S13, chloroplastic isoform X2 [Macadamia integrifolia]